MGGAGRFGRRYGSDEYERDREREEGPYSRLARDDRERDRDREEVLYPRRGFEEGEREGDRFGTSLRKRGFDEDEKDRERDSGGSSFYAKRAGFDDEDVGGYARRAGSDDDDRERGRQGVSYGKRAFDDDEREREWERGDRDGGFYRKRAAYEDEDRAPPRGRDDGPPAPYGKRPAFDEEPERGRERQSGSYTTARSHEDSDREGDKYAYPPRHHRLPSPEEPASRPRAESRVSTLRLTCMADSSRSKSAAPLV